MSQTPADNTFGIDKDQVPAQGGFTAAGVGLTQEMVAGSAAGLGIAKVAVDPAASASTSGNYNDIALTNVATQLSAVSVPCSAVLLTNDDGAGTTPGNAVIYWGFDNTLTTSNGTPLRGGGQVSITISDVSKLWVIGSVAGPTSVRWAAI